MTIKRTIPLAIIAMGVLSACSAHAQPDATSGLYQIISGRFTECCGFAGEFTYPLPTAGQQFVELAVDTARHRAQMRFLNRDRQPAFGIFGGLAAGSLSNGIVFPDHIEFTEPVPLPPPDQPHTRYSVSNTADALRINGVVVTACPNCVDRPTRFEHVNVVAVSMPTASIRMSEAEICWNANSNRTYQIQYRSALTANDWTPLGLPLRGNGATNCITDKVPAGSPQRYYRVLTLP